jgi:hypothetical protein
VRLAGWGWDQRYTIMAGAACVLFLLAAEAANVYNNRRRSAPLRFDFRNLAGAWSVTVVGVLS